MGWTCLTVRLLLGTPEIKMKQNQFNKYIQEHDSTEHGSVMFLVHLSSNVCIWSFFFDLCATIIGNKATWFTCFFPFCLFHDWKFTQGILF